MYSLDTNAAKNASVVSRKISEIGKYVGKIVYARDVKSRKGTVGVEIKFLSNSGQDATFTLWVYGEDSNELIGYRQLNAIMTCVKVKGIAPSVAKIKLWDWDERAEVEKEANVFKELTDKKIGILFETEDYERQDGQIRSKVVPAHFFEADTELTASEILDKKSVPERLPKLVESLRHRPVKGLTKPVAAKEKAEPFIDDDIPF